MSGYTTLLGAEDVARAGHNMQSAAETMSRAASTLDSGAERLGMVLQEHAARIESAAGPSEERPTLRDYLAANATEFDIRCALEDLGRSGGLSRCRSAIERNAAARYAHADAMLKVRNGNG